MRVAFDITQSQYEGSGVAAYTRELALALIGESVNIEYVLFGFSAGNIRSFDSFKKRANKINPKAEIKIFPLPVKAAEFMGNIFRFPTLERLIGDFDIYHSSDWIQFPSGKIKVTTIHDLVVYKYPQYSTEKIIRVQKRKLKLSAGECSFFFCDSESTKKDAQVFLKIPAEKLKVVYPGVTQGYPQRLNESSVYNGKKFGVKAGRFLFTLSKIEPRKNLKSLISAFNILKKIKEFADYKLLISGVKGWDFGLEKSDDVIFAGYMEEPDVKWALANCACFVYPSYYEGFGFPVLEAKLAGAPVVSSGRGSLSELKIDKDYICNPHSPRDIADKIAMSIKRPERNKIIEQNRSFAQNFSWKKAAEKISFEYINLYKNRKK